jgi:hypothetical protein
MGSNSFFVTPFNSLFTHFIKYKSKISLLDTFGSKSYTESYGVIVWEIARESGIGSLVQWEMHIVKV